MADTQLAGEPQTEVSVDPLTALVEEVIHLPPEQAVKHLDSYSNERIVEVLMRLNPQVSGDILYAFPETRRHAVIAAAPLESSRQWARNHQYPDDSIGRLMDPPIGIFRPDMTVKETIEVLRELVKKALITYAFVIDNTGKLVGVVVMRDLLLAAPEQRLEEMMLRSPFALKPEMPLTDAMNLVVARHYPVYPVCDDAGSLVGLVRGQSLFEAQAFEISAQAGSMVGVEKEERLATPFWKSFFFRHPWLELNLLTAFVAAFVVGVFEGTIEKLVMLAVFQPVLAGQSGNTGCQTLAVVLRGMTLGELKSRKVKSLVRKEALLGLTNGIVVGLVAGIAMYIYATMKSDPYALKLGIVTWIAMVVSCAISGVSGAMIPLVLKKMGADPATASSIFLTTATDVASMTMFFGLATILIM